MNLGLNQHTLCVHSSFYSPSGCSDPGPDPDPELMEHIQPAVSVSPHGRFERLQEDPNYISHFTRTPGHKGQRRLHCFLLRYCTGSALARHNPVGYLVCGPTGWSLIGPVLCVSHIILSNQMTLKSLLLMRTCSDRTDHSAAPGQQLLVLFEKTGVILALKSQRSSCSETSKLPLVRINPDFPDAFRI